MLRTANLRTTAVLTQATQITAQLRGRIPIYGRDYPLEENPSYLAKQRRDASSLSALAMLAIPVCSHEMIGTAKLRRVRFESIRVSMHEGDIREQGDRDT